MGKTPSLADFFGENAAIYESSGNLRKQQLETTSRSMELLISPWDSCAGLRALDLGCGTGWSTGLMLSAGFASVIGLDLSMDMLRFARERDLSVCAGDIRAGLPFRNGSFEAIISVSAVNFLAEGVRDRSGLRALCGDAARELYRVLSPGGRCVLQYFRNDPLEKGMMEALAEAGFQGGAVVDGENTRTEKRYFVLERPGECARKFSRRVEDFVCARCGCEVRGDGYTNHCPECLWSRHVDVNPGDRRAGCAGMMEPIQVEYGRNEFVIIHRCTRCGMERRVRASAMDSRETIFRILGRGSGNAGGEKDRAE